MNEPIRILHWGMTPSIGGMENFVMEIYRHIDRNKIQFDFLISHNGQIAYEDEINKLGGKIHRITYNFKENPYLYTKALDDFFKKHKEIKGIHMHSCFIGYSKLLKIAKKYNIKIRIYHSHNSDNMYPNNSLLYKILELKNKKDIKKYATNLFACSQKAGEYMFDKSKFIVIKNAIDLKKFSYDKNIRKKKRLELDIENKLVIGSVGRLQYQKNPLYIVDIFNELYKKNKNAILIMVGEGDLYTSIVDRIKKYKLEDCVKLLGHREDINHLMQAFDVFLFPSIFEGLGIVLIEAQASGLPCLTSNCVPLEAKATDIINFMSLDDCIENWTNRLLALAKLPRTSHVEQLKENGYDILDLASSLAEFYIKQLENRRV